MASALGRDVTIDEIAEEMTRQGWSITPVRLATIRGASEKGVPLESNNPEEEWSPIGWLSSDDSATAITEKGDSLTRINGILDSLTLLERDVIQRKLGLITGQEETYDTIGLRYEHTGEWARQIYMKGLRKARKKVKLLKIKEYNS
jgi:hypothetical protein